MVAIFKKIGNPSHGVQIGPICCSAQWSIRNQHVDNLLVTLKVFFCNTLYWTWVEGVQASLFWYKIQWPLALIKASSNIGCRYHKGKPTSFAALMIVISKYELEILHVGCKLVQFVAQLNDQYRTNMWTICLSLCHPYILYFGPKRVYFSAKLDNPLFRSNTEAYL